MSDISASLKDEHEAFAKEIEFIRIAADAVGAASAQTLARDIDKIDDFLLRRLLPHALAEEQVLYAAVAKIFGTPGATAPMSLEHAEINHFAKQMRALREEVSAGALDADQANDLRAILYGLYTLTKSHLTKEEQLYFSLLDEHLTEPEAHEMLHAMAEVARRSGAHGDH